MKKIDKIDTIKVDSYCHAETDIGMLACKINELIAAVNILAGHETPGLFEENPICLPDNTKIHKPIPGRGKWVYATNELYNKIKVGYWLEIAGNLYTVDGIECYSDIGKERMVFIKKVKPTNKYER